MVLVHVTLHEVMVLTMSSNSVGERNMRSKRRFFASGWTRRHAAKSSPKRSMRRTWALSVAWSPRGTTRSQASTNTPSAR